MTGMFGGVRSYQKCSETYRSADVAVPVVAAGWFEPVSEIEGVRRCWRGECNDDGGCREMADFLEQRGHAFSFNEDRSCNWMWLSSAVAGEENIDIEDEVFIAITFRVHRINFDNLGILFACLVELRRCKKQWPSHD